MKVFILVTIPRSELLANCTLVFHKLRVGFPTAEIHVYDNANRSDMSDAVWQLAKATRSEYHQFKVKQHHATFISQTLQTELQETVFLDPDVQLWENCEDIKFERMWAGYFTPLMWNEFAQTISAPRIHTSFMWFKFPPELLRAIKRAYPNAFDKTAAYSPCDPFMPDVKFVNGKAMFWDTCANLYNMLPGSHFTQDVLRRYDHVPSSSFYDVMLDRVSDKAGFARLHKVAREHPNKLRNMWAGVDAYYRNMNKIALDCLKESPVCLT